MVVTITFTRVQSKASASGIDPATAVFDATPTEDNLLKITVSERSGGSAAGMNLLAPATGWTKEIADTTEQGQTNFRRTQVVWWKVAGASEPTSISADDGTASGKRILIEEYSAGVPVTWEFLDSISNNTGVGSTSPLNSGNTGSTSGVQLLLGGAIWRQESGQDITTVSFDGLAGLILAQAAGAAIILASAFAQTEDSGVKSTEVSWNGTGNEGNVHLLVFSATEIGGSSPVPPPLVTLPPVAVP
jgi:hypothetical protein